MDGAPHRIVKCRGELVNYQGMEAVRFDKIDLEKLQQEFARSGEAEARRSNTFRQLLERQLADMLARNPQRMDYYNGVGGDLPRQNDDRHWIDDRTSAIKEK